MACVEAMTAVVDGLDLVAVQGAAPKTARLATLVGVVGHRLVSTGSVAHLQAHSAATCKRADTHTTIASTGAGEEGREGC